MNVRRVNLVKGFVSGLGSMMTVYTRRRLKYNPKHTPQGMLREDMERLGYDLSVAIEKAHKSEKASS